VHQEQYKGRFLCPDGGRRGEKKQERIRRGGEERVKILKKKTRRCRGSNGCSGGGKFNKCEEALNAGGKLQETIDKNLPGMRLEMKFDAIRT